MEERHVTDEFIHTTRHYHHYVTMTSSLLGATCGGQIGIFVSSIFTFFICRWRWILHESWKLPWRAARRGENTTSSTQMKKFKYITYYLAPFLTLCYLMLLSAFLFIFFLTTLLLSSSCLCHFFYSLSLSCFFNVWYHCRLFVSV